MIFSGQETHESYAEARKDVSKSKEITPPPQIAEIIKKKWFLASFLLGGTLSSAFNFLKSYFHFVWRI